MVDVKSRVVIVAPLGPTSLACCVISFPHMRARIFPRSACIEILSFRCYPAKPPWVQFATLVPHRVIFTSLPPFFQSPRLRHAASFYSVLLEPKDYRGVRHSVHLCDIASAQALVDVMLNKPLFFSEWLVFPPMLALHKLAVCFSLHNHIIHSIRSMGKRVYPKRCKFFCNPFGGVCFQLHSIRHV